MGKCYICKQEMKPEEDDIDFFNPLIMDGKVAAAVIVHTRCKVEYEKKEK